MVDVVRKEEHDAALATRAGFFLLTQHVFNVMMDSAFMLCQLLELLTVIFPHSYFPYKEIHVTFDNLFNILIPPQNNPTTAVSVGSAVEIARLHLVVQKFNDLGSKSSTPPSGALTTQTHDLGI